MKGYTMGRQLAVATAVSILALSLVGHQVRADEWDIFPPQAMLWSGPFRHPHLDIEFYWPFKTRKQMTATITWSRSPPAIQQVRTRIVCKRPGRRWMYGVMNVGSFAPHRDM